MVNSKKKTPHTSYGEKTKEIKTMEIKPMDRVFSMVIIINLNSMDLSTDVSHSLKV